MCGIVGAVAKRNITNILIDGLKRLEYRGYDSAGVAVVNHGQMYRLRRLGKVKVLEEAIAVQNVTGNIGIAHTRWATHGQPSENNAHPLVSDNIVVIHNGIIENHQVLRTFLIKQGYQFVTETDTEVIAHLVHYERQRSPDLLSAVQQAIKQLKGAYGAVIMDSLQDDEIIAARSGSPLVIGLGKEENYVASDQLALFPVTDQFIYLDEGDIAQVTDRSVVIFDKEGYEVKRNSVTVDTHIDLSEKGLYSHFMLKEIDEQPTAIKNSIDSRIVDDHVVLHELSNSKALLSKVKHIQIIACGTSFHAGMVARYWFEAFAGIPCSVEIASEFRYRQVAVSKDSLVITLSQSGETADTLAALRKSKQLGYLASLCICNVNSSSLVRESDLCLLTKAGIEIGVASTKAFTTQLSVLLLLVCYLGRLNEMSETTEANIVQAIKSLPIYLEKLLAIGSKIKDIAEEFVDKQHILFLGRGIHYPIAMEGALKLKEISYIHAEAYAAGELKHGPLALIDGNMPVIVIVPNDELLDKLKSNIEEIRARRGKLYLFAEEGCDFPISKNVTVINIPKVNTIVSPIYFTIPLQFISYYVALLKGTDIDQPRNLAKSVTVE